MREGITRRFLGRIIDNVDNPQQYGDHNSLSEIEIENSKAVDFPNGEVALRHCVGDARPSPPSIRDLTGL